MFSLLRKVIPEPIINFYHLGLSLLASLVFRFPSDSMIVIGVTGTNGKSSVAYFLSKLLEASGYKTGLISTALIKIDQEEKLNDLKMTMPGRFSLQYLLSKMRRAGCHYAIVETSSQGLIQFRHRGINYDYAVFTNLTPEHIEAHRGFENYKRAKGKLFQSLSSQKKKIINGKEIAKTIIVNLDDEHAPYFLSFNADKKIGFTLANAGGHGVEAIYNLNDLRLGEQGMSFNFEATDFQSELIGEFNAYNLAASLSLCFNEKLDLLKLKEITANIKGVPGRLEKIIGGQNFTLIVDYAPEPFALEASYKALDIINKNRLIHVLGSCGGGRDVARRPILGRLAGKKADVVIVTNEDPYDDDPLEIINSVAHGAIESGKVIGFDLFTEIDRSRAIAKAIDMAMPGDLVFITGKGCEQFIMGKHGKKIPHDDREVAKKFLQLKMSKKI